METRFSQILKFRRSIVDKIELEVMQVNNLIFSKKREIEALHKTIAEFTPPEAQEYMLFLAYRDTLSNIREKINAENNILQMLESRKIDTLKRFKKAQIEYEKINDLHLEEVQIALKKAQKSEAKSQDELAQIKYIARKKARGVDSNGTNAQINQSAKIKGA